MSQKPPTNLIAGFLKKYMIVVSGIFLIGCVSSSDTNLWGKRFKVPQCPVVQLLKDTDIIIVYKKGPGRDITDIRYEAELKSFNGNCEYIRDKGEYKAVKVTFRVSFDIAIGPSEVTRALSVPYFIALPTYYPAPYGKQEFIANIKFPKNQDKVSYTDEDVEITIPLDKKTLGPDIKIYIGFKLTPEQLRGNQLKTQSFRIN